MNGRILKVKKKKRSILVYLWLTLPFVIGGTKCLIYFWKVPLEEQNISKNLGYSSDESFLYLLISTYSLKDPSPPVLF